jgi:hypothetical protein
MNEVTSDANHTMLCMDQLSPATTFTCLTVARKVGVMEGCRRVDSSKDQVACTWLG